MIQLGFSGGTLLLVPISSRTMTRQCVALADAADTRAVRRSRIKLPVLPYHAPPSRNASGFMAGQTYFGVPSL